MPRVTTREACQTKVGEFVIVGGYIQGEREGLEKREGMALVAAWTGGRVCRGSVTAVDFAVMVCLFILLPAR